MLLRSRTGWVVAWLLLALFGLPPAVAAPQLGELAPPLELAGLDGTPLRLPTTGNQLLVVDFFATWCGPCRQAMAALDNILPSLGPRVRLVVVDVNEPPELVRRYFADKRLPPRTQVAIDSDGQVARRWGQDRLPTTFLVDEQGIIRHINRGYGPGYAARLLGWLRAMLK